MLLRHVTLTLGAGDALRVDGPNGAGKSSLLRAVAGLLRPVSGRIERAGAVALVDERPGFDGDRPLARELGWWVGGRPVDAALVAMDLDRVAAVPMRHLSLGQTRRAAIARAIAGGAALWLLDEPGGGLDADGRRRLDAAVARHRADGGAVLLADHRPPAWPDLSTLDLARHTPA